MTVTPDQTARKERREQRIVAMFVEIVDTIVDDFDLIDFLHRLALRCVDLLDCAEVGVLLADTSGALRVMASSSERTDALEVLQSQNEEGPCYECFVEGETISSEDLSTDSDRWPAFAPIALSKGFRSVHALPMRVHGQTVGALNLFRASTGKLADDDVPLGQGMADVAAIALLQERVVRESNTLVAQLQGALTSRVVIEQAKGILAEQAQIRVDEAFLRLRAHARKCNLSLGDVARQLIDGRLDAHALDRPGVH